MPMISNNVSVAANAQSGNVLGGDPYEFLSRPAIVSLYSTGSASGLVITFQLGGLAVAQSAVIPPTNRFPLRQEDGIVQVAGRAGARLFLEFLNTTAGALTANWLIDIDFR